MVRMPRTLRTMLILPLLACCLQAPAQTTKHKPKLSVEAQRDAEIARINR